MRESGDTIVRRRFEADVSFIELRHLTMTQALVLECSRMEWLMSRVSPHAHERTRGRSGQFFRDRCNQPPSCTIRDAGCFFATDAVPSEMGNGTTATRDPAMAARVASACRGFTPERRVLVGENMRDFSRGHRLCLVGALTACDAAIIPVLDCKFTASPDKPTSPFS